MKLTTRFRRARGRILIGSVLLFAVALAFLPRACDGENRLLDDKARAEAVAAGGRFAKLERGTTHYELAGEGGVTVVLVHGTMGPMTVWDATKASLVAAGFRVLLFDFYGRGYSDRIEGEYDLDVFVGQLGELLAEVGGGDRVVLVGSSLGAVVVAEYARRQPEGVLGTVFVGPAGFPLEASILARLARVAGVGDYMMSVLGDSKLLEHHRRYFVEPERFESYHRGFSEQLRFYGSKAAILSTLRHAPVESYLDGYAAYGASGLSTLVLWGVLDPAFPISNRPLLSERVPQAEIVEIPGVGHLPQLEAAEETGGRIVRFARGLGTGEYD